MGGQVPDSPGALHLSGVDSYAPHSERCSALERTYKPQNTLMMSTYLIRCFVSWLGVLQSVQALRSVPFVACSTAATRAAALRLPADQTRQQQV